MLKIDDMVWMDSGKQMNHVQPIHNSSSAFSSAQQKYRLEFIYSTEPIHNNSNKVASANLI